VPRIYAGTTGAFPSEARRATPVWGSTVQSRLRVPSGKIPIAPPACKTSSERLIAAVALPRRSTAYAPRARIIGPSTGISKSSFFAI